MIKKISQYRFVFILIVFAFMIYSLISIGYSSNIEASNIKAMEKVYANYFDGRMPCENTNKDYMSQFKGEMIEEKVRFTNRQNISLQGYWYKPANGVSPKGIVIISHGFNGNGSRGDINTDYELVKRGFWVFAYDATGTGESDGNGIGFFSRNSVDLSDAINYVKRDKSVNHNLPIHLWGCSWGGYAVLNALNEHNDIKSVVSFCGFDNSIELLVDHFITHFPEETKEISKETIKEYISKMETLRGGFVASHYTAIDGMKNAKNTDILIFHGNADDLVPINLGLGKYKKDSEITNRANITMITLDGINHGIYGEPVIQGFEFINHHN